MCYVAPVATAVAVTLAWRKNPSLKNWWLLLMFYGASMFGVLDHLWNGELFLISENWFQDLSLGVVITGAVFLTWRLLLFLAQKNSALRPSLMLYPEK